MWPFDRRSDVLRVGRERVELWAQSGRGLVLREEQPLAGDARDGAALRAAATKVLERTKSAAVPPIDLVVESAWLPAMSIEPGLALLARAQVEALLRYRIGQVYGRGDEAGGAWALMLDHRPGDRHGVGYALSTAVRAALLGAVADAGRKVVSLQPALAWGRVRLGHRLPKDGWCLWAEQDRTLIAHLRHGRMQALHAGASTLRNAAQVRRLVDVEAARQGIEHSKAPVVVAGWQEVFVGASAAGGPGPSWLSVAAPDLKRSATGSGPLAPLERAA